MAIQLSMIVTMTSWAPVWDFRTPAMLPQIAPPTTPARMAAIRWIGKGIE